ncbi:MAG: hypothetical protein RXR08_11610 [Sulfolobaceae archaeon]
MTRNKENTWGFSSLSSFSNRFLVVYIFGTPGTKMNLFEGEVEGSIIETGSIVYRGWAKEQKFLLEIRFEAKAIKPMEMLLRIFMTAEYKVSGLDKLLESTSFALAQHIVEEHIIPYVKYYFKTESGLGSEGITPTKLLDEQGLLSQILPKITKVSEDVEYGVAVTKGENVSGNTRIKNGKIAGIEMNHKGQKLQVQVAMLELVSLLTPVSVSLYTVNLDEVLVSRLEKMYSLILLKDSALYREHITFTSRRHAYLTLLFPFLLLKSRRFELGSLGRNA